MTDLEWAQRIVLESVHGDPGLCADVADALTAARREGAEVERAQWMRCAKVDQSMANIITWNLVWLDRLWRRYYHNK